MLLRVITGGQTGADQAAWQAAKAAGIPTGGAMPRGFLTEQGPRPEFAELFNAHELPTLSYAVRTHINVRAAEAVVWFGNIRSSGARCAIGTCEKIGRPRFIVGFEEPLVRPSQVAKWLADLGTGVLMVGGHRESVAPGIGQRVEAFLGRVFRLLAGEQRGAGVADQQDHHVEPRAHLLTTLFISMIPSTSFTSLSPVSIKR
jgi:Circularly permutated YpsA SLOG family